MKKQIKIKYKIALIATILLSCFILSGCDNEYGEDIKIYDDNYNTASYIEMDTKYKLKGYNKEYTENGCIVHIYYETKGA